jgi:hypothetical protein
MMRKKAEVNLRAFGFQKPVSQGSVRKNTEHKKGILKDI